MSLLKDITGQKFGKLTAIARVGFIPPNGSVWLFKCECGNEKAIPLKYVKSRTTSCGCAHKTRTLPPGQSAINKTYRNYKSSAKTRLLCFDLSLKDFIKLIFSNCYYCGTPPCRVVTEKSGSQITCNGIDRIDNNDGYRLDNCVPCCANCNFAKNDMSYSDFVKWITRLISNFKGENNEH